MTTALLASTTAIQPLAWLQQALHSALKSAPRRSVRAISQEVRQLRKGETLVVEGTGGQGVVCLDGALWITHEHTQRDPIAGRGDRQTAVGCSRMLVHALADSRLCLPSSLPL